MVVYQQEIGTISNIIYTSYIIYKYKKRPGGKKAMRGVHH